MDKTDTIPRIMKKHHHEIEGLLNRFRKHQGEPEQFPKTFDKFKWELKKHFLLEEKAIFIFIYQEDDEIYKMKNEILSDHRAILKELDKIEGDLKNNETVNIFGLEERLKKHRDYEDDTFYPKLEEELDESKKKEILTKISTPV